MLSTVHVDLKQMILTSWRDRWSEKKWSINIRKYLTSPSDIFHVADALVSQAFIGPSPNQLLLEYIWHALNTGLLTYSSVITAISKHEDLHKVQSTKGVYKLLQQLITFLNNNPITEDVMHMCSALRMSLQWLLRNIEQYLKGVAEVSPSVAEELLQLNCLTLELLTTKPRTSALLTIARFEESGVWSHIETDLAVIKNRSGHHSMHAEISESCHYVSQLSKCPIPSKAVYQQQYTSRVCLSVSTLLSLEVECKRQTDDQALAQQLVMLSNILGLTHAQLLFHCFQTCLMGYLDATGRDDDNEVHWCAMLLLRLPKLVQKIKSHLVGSEFESPSGSSSKKAADFDLSVCESLKKIAVMDRLIDSLDQLRNGLDWIKIITEHFEAKSLLSEAAKAEIQEKRNVIRANMSMNFSSDCINPLMIIKMEETVEQMIKVLGSQDINSELDSLLNMLQSLLKKSSFELFAAAASYSRQLNKILSKLIACNEAVKTSTGENPKTAQVRAVVFDITFMLTCYLIKMFGRDAFADAMHYQRGGGDGSFLQQWTATWCSTNINSVQTKSMDPDANQASLLLQALRNSNEFRIILAKWHEVCTNMPAALLDLIQAYQKGYIKMTELLRAVSVIRDHCPLSVCLSCVVVIANRARLVHSHAEHITVLEKLVSKSESHQQVQALYDQRYEFFSSVAIHLAGDLLPEHQAAHGKKSAIKKLQEAFNDTVKSGWINQERLKNFKDSLNDLGVSAFMRRILSLVLRETRQDSVEIVVNIVFACMQLDVQPMVIYLLKHGVPRHFLIDTHVLAPPIGKPMAQLTVAALDIALNDAILQDKSLLPLQPIDPFLDEVKPYQDQNIKVRRMLSCCSEHDLSSNASRLSPNHPLVIVLDDFLQCLWKALQDHDWGPIPDFVSHFIKMALSSSPLLSRTVKQCLNAKMVAEFAPTLIEEKADLLFAASDLGSPEIRRMAAQAICEVESL